MRKSIIRGTNLGINHRCLLPAYRLSFVYIFSAVAGNEQLVWYLAFAGLFLSQNNKVYAETNTYNYNEVANKPYKLLAVVIS